MSSCMGIISKFVLIFYLYILCVSLCLFLVLSGVRGCLERLPRAGQSLRAARQKGTSPEGLMVTRAQWPQLDMQAYGWVGRWICGPEQGSPHWWRGAGLQGGPGRPWLEVGVGIQILEASPGLKLFGCWALGEGGVSLPSPPWLTKRKRLVFPPLPSLLPFGVRPGASVLSSSQPWVRPPPSPTPALITGTLILRLIPTSLDPPRGSRGQPTDVGGGCDRMA